MSKTTKKIAIGAAIAGVTGYVAGILTAPKSGKETRQDIKDTAVKARNEAEKRLKALHGDLSKLIDEGKKQAANLKDKAKQELDSALEVANISKQKAKEMLSAVREGQADDKDLQKAIDDANTAIKHLSSYLKKNA
jgi:gas vesicle protein